MFAVKFRRSIEAVRVTNVGACAYRAFGVGLFIIGCNTAHRTPDGWTVAWQARRALDPLEVVDGRGGHGTAGGEAQQLWPRERGPVGGGGG